MNEQQETREKEISLTDLIFYCMERWRYILLFMLIMGVLAGAYKYLATVRSNQAISQKEKSLDQSESTATAGDAAKSDAAGKDEPGINAADIFRSPYGMLRRVERWRNAICYLKSCLGMSEKKEKQKGKWMRS